MVFVEHRHDDNTNNHSTLDTSLNDLDISLNQLLTNQRKLKCRLINKGKQVPMYYETPNPFSDVAGENKGRNITIRAKGEFLRGEIINDRYSLKPIINDGSINYHLYSYVVSFWWIITSLLAPLMIGLLMFVWQYDSYDMLNKDIANSKFLGIVMPILDLISVPAHYKLTILKEDGNYNNDLLRPLLGLIIVIHILYSIFKDEQYSWSLWIFTVYSILIVSFILLLILVLLPGSYWAQKEKLLGKGPGPIVVSIISYFVISYYVESFVIMDMQKAFDV